MSFEKRIFLGYKDIPEGGKRFLTLPVLKVLKKKRKRKEKKKSEVGENGFDYLYYANPSVWQIRMIRHTGY